MKLLRILFPALFVFLFSCGESASLQPDLTAEDNFTSQHFRLDIMVETDSADIIYMLTDSSLVVQDMPAINESRMAVVLVKVDLDETVPGAESLAEIAKLDVKSHSCKEQHALVARGITFTNDTGLAGVNLNINHPHELDVAVDIINRLVPENLQLRFKDMQSAIEPDGKMRL